MMRIMLLLISLLLMIVNIECVYGPNSDVISATDKTFSSEVLKHPGIVIGNSLLLSLLSLSSLLSQSLSSSLSQSLTLYHYYNHNNFND